MARKEKRPMWGLYGGFMVSSDCYTDDQNHRHYFGIMQGLVVTEPKRLLTDPNKRKQREQRKYISFTVATDPQERWRVRVYETEKFFNIAQALQRFDTVLLCGEYVEYEYTLRTGRLAGEIRTGRDYRVTFILPAFAILDPEGYRQSFLRPADEHSWDVEDGTEDLDEPDWTQIPKDKILGYKGG